MMTKLFEDVTKLADIELSRANENYPLFSSDHEGSAVIHEEVEEAESEMHSMHSYYKYLWDCVKRDESVACVSKNLKHAALLCAAECI